ncbi:MAG: hypothetical protein Q8N23_18245 [Archangium sp.]|nr:hypothetical protein [Archangium sp.]MDP3574374.1 hypothetical protein [Archangium sp.]
MTGGGRGNSGSWERWCTNTYVPGLCDAAVRCGTYSNRTICEDTAAAFNSCGSSPDCAMAPCDSTRPCSFGSQCGPANVCVVSGDIGATCTTQGSGECLPNLICDIPTGASTGSCSRIHTLGESCSYFGFQCGFSVDLYCTATSTSAGVCALRKGLGASCQSGGECNSGVCTNGLCGGCADPTP